MAGRSTSEEMDAFDDVTPSKAVSIYDLVEDLPTRAQSSDEIAEFQRQARIKRESAHKSFPAPKANDSKPPPEPTTTSSNRPIPRESGPMLIDRLRLPRAMSESEQASQPARDQAHDEMDDVLRDVAATIQKLPPAPRLPHFEPSRASLETIHGMLAAPREPSPPDRGWPSVLLWALGLSLVTLAIAGAIFLSQ